MTSVNDKCPCNSGLKYKKCCLAKDRANKMLAKAQRDSEYYEGHEFSEKTNTVRTMLADKVPEYTAIDITNIITNSNRTAVVAANSGRKVFIIAERTMTTNPIFTALKVADSDNMLVMYRQNFQCFNYEKELLEAIKVICEKSSRNK